jgi:lipopolysaccharide export LptBFGC system permease protein LptF
MANNKLTEHLTFYNKPLDSEAAKRVIANAERAAYNLEQQINKTNMTDETNTTNINNNTQTNTTDTNDYPPMWKRLAKSFVAMMLVFMFVYAGMNILMWLYDTLGMEHVMPTLIGLVLWVVVYDHMYGTASKAPRIK